MVAKERNMLLSVLRSPSLHLLYSVTFILCTCRTVEDNDVTFYWHSSILGDPL